MRAVSRLGMAWMAAALALGPSIALAQAVPQATTNTPAADSIGPKELQNFSLTGTVTQRSDQPAQVPAAAPPHATRAQARPVAQSPAEEPAPVRTAANDRPRPTQDSAANAPAQPAPERPRQLAASSTAPSPLRAAQAGAGDSASPPVTQAASPGFAADPAATPGTLASEHKFPIIPWLLATLALAAGGIFLFRRNRPREAFAGGPQVDAFVAPEDRPIPVPPPRPAPAPPKAPAGSIPGVVSTRLRPWIDIGFQPLRCILDHDKAAIEFEFELFNSGSGPARDVLVEASLFNAGATQDRDLGAFFANPVGEGDRIAAIAPLKRVALKTQVAIGRDQVQAYELGGRQVFVPLIGFNALYRWSGGEGQTSVSYLLGIDTKSDKLGPFRLDLGPRLFRGLAARLLPAGVRQ
jgi:hypothetical protein